MTEILSPFGTPGVALQLALRRTAAGILGLMGRDDPRSFELDRPIAGPGAPGPSSPIAGAGHPYMAAAMGLRLDERALAKLAGVIHIAPRVTLTVTLQERQRGLRAIAGGLRTPPVAYDRFPYNAAPLGGGTALARPLPNMSAGVGSALPCIDCT